MDYIQELVSDNMGPEYIPTLPQIPKINIPVYTAGQDIAVMPTQPVQGDVWADLKAVTQRPVSEGQLSVQHFPGDITRFKENENYQVFGYNPDLAGIKTDDKIYDANEVRYQHAQTWGDVMSNAVGQFAGLAWNSFKNSAVSDGRFLSAIFSTPFNDKSFMENAVGTPEQLLEQDKEQKAILNKYAIFHSPEVDNSVLNKEFIGDAIGQLGFTAGTATYMLGTALVGGAIAEGILGATKGMQLSRAGKLLETAGALGKGEEAVTVLENYRKTQNTAQAIKELKELTDVAKNRDVMTRIWDGIKNLTPGYQAANDIRLANLAGGTFGQSISAGLPGLIRSYTLFSAARSEASMEAASTYGTIYMNLLDEYERTHGQPPTGQDAERIRQAAYGAATDNFIVNTGLLMVANELEFGGMLSKFSSSKRLFREAAEQATNAEGKAMYTISGKAARDIGEVKAGEVAAKVYEKGKFGALSNFGAIRKDFGLGTALYQTGKRLAKSQAAKFELAEGVQEILQSTSDKALREYYTNLYNGNKDLDGATLKDVNWQDGLAQQINMEGWKTFLMGSVTGLFLSPLSAMGMYARHKGAMAVNEQYKDTYNQQQGIIKDNIGILNSFYSDPKTAFNDHIAAFKVTSQAIRNMKESLPLEDRYTFYNSQDDILTKAAATAMKTGTGEAFLDTIRSLGDGRLTDKEFAEAMNMPQTGEETVSARAAVTKVAADIEQYYTNYQNLKDKFSDLIVPDAYSDPLKKSVAMIQKKALDEAIEILATTDYHATQTLIRAAEIKNTMSQISGVGSSVNRAFEVMASNHELDNDIRQYKSQLSALQGLTDKDSNQMRKDLEAITGILENWKTGYKEYEKTQDKGLEETLKKLFKTYLLFNNSIQGIGPRTINDQDITRAFEGLGDYIALNRDNSKYVEALNILTDPEAFRALHDRIVQGLKGAAVDNSITAEDEIVERAKGTTTPPPADTDTPPDTPPTPTPEGPRPVYSVDELGKLREDIVTYYQYSNRGTDVELSQEAGEFISYYPELQKELNIIIRDLDKQKTMYGALQPNEITQYEKRITAAIDNTIETIKKEREEADKPPVPVVYTKLPQSAIINDQNRVYGVPAKEVSNILRGIQPDNQGMITEGVELRIARNIYGIRPVQDGFQLYNTVNNRAYTVYPTEQEAIAAVENKTAPYSYQDNPMIQQNRESYEIGMYRGEQFLGFLANPGKYTFIFPDYTDYIPHSAEDLARVVDTGSISPDEAYHIWQKQYIQSQQLQAIIDKVIEGKNSAVIEGTDLEQVMKIYRKVSGYDFMTADKDNRPLLKKVLETGGRLVAVTGRDGEVFVGDIDNTYPPVPAHITTDRRALIEKDGQLHWIELDPRLMTEGDITKLTESIQQMQSLPAGQERDVVIQTVKDRLSRVLITLKPIDDLKKIALVYDTNQKGDPIVRINAIPRTGPLIKNRMPVLNIGETGTENRLNNLADIINSKMNKFFTDKKLPYNLSITSSNIRVNPPKNPTEADLVSMQAGVGEHIATYSVGYSMVPSSIPEEVIPQVTTQQSIVEEIVALRSEIRLTSVSENAKVNTVAESIEEDESIESVLKRLNDPASVDTSAIESKRQEELSGNIPLQKGDKVTLKSYSSGVEDREAVITAVGPYGFKTEGSDKWQDYKKGIWDRWVNHTGKDRINAKYDKLVAQANSQVVRKILNTTEPFTESSVVNIDLFRQWCTDNLPQDITVEDLGTLTDNLQQGNVTVGKFLTSLKTIQVYRDSPYKYHEAFHAIFRLLLPDSRIQQLLDIARKEHPVTAKGLQSMRDMHPDYSNMGEKELEDRYLEEYIADKFDKWMTNKKVRTSHIIKGFFAKLADWIKELFSRMTSNRIQSLFYEINRGKYQKAQLQDNQFTTDDISTPAMKVIEIGTQVIQSSNGDMITMPRYLPQQKGEQLACTISALFYQKIQTDPQQSKNKILDGILDQYRDMLYPVQERYNVYQKTITDKVARVQWIKDLSDLYKVFNTDSSRQSVKEAVDEHLRIMGYRQSLEDDLYTNMENTNGPRTTADYNKEADMYGGLSSLTSMLREYVGSTTRPYVDEFGNTQFLDGTPLIEAVSAGQVYNGMLSILANSSDDNQLIDRMLLYLEDGNNSQTVAFINRILIETGFDRDVAGVWIVPKNPLLLQQIIKGFNNYNVNPLFADLQPGGNIRIYSPNRQDSAKVQFDKWHQAFQDIYMSQYDLKRGKKEFTDKRGKPIVTLKNLISAAQQDKSITDSKLKETSRTLSNEIKLNIGIDLHPSYIAYSIVSARDNRTEYQQMLYNAYTGTYVIIYDDTDGILESMKQDGNIFINPEGISAGAATRLLKIAAGNAVFDETVDSMTYRGPDNEIHYSSQKPNYHMVRTQQLNNPDIIEELRDSPSHNNFLLDQDSMFIHLSEQGKLHTEAVSGMKIREDIPGTEEAISSDFEDTGSAGNGVPYKSMNEREFQAFMLSMYGIQDNKVQYGAGKEEYFYTTPHLITVIEAKSTGHMVRLPVNKAVYDGKLSPQTIDRFYTWVQQEVDRIQRVQQEIADGTGNKVGYHTGIQRGLHLYNTKLWFSPEMREGIEQGTITDPAIIKQAIQDYWQDKIADYIDYLHDMGLIARTGSTITNRLIPSFLFDGFGTGDRDNRMNLKAGDFVHNISQVYINDMLNTTAIRQLLYGDESTAFKDNIDRVKRAAGANASGENMAFSYSAPELGIDHSLTHFHHVTYKSTPYTKMSGDKPGDKDDAQMYSTEKGFRYMLFGFGRLTKVQAAILDKLKNGTPVTEKEFFGAGGLKEHGAFNSRKVVYFDNNLVYLKCSLFPLFKEFTSWQDRSGIWHPKVHMQQMHDLREKLEEYENRNNTVVYAGPDTHSKGLKEDVADNIGSIQDRNFKQLGAQWMRLQLENPSNKLVITDPTQAKQQILSEQDDNLPVLFMGNETTVGAVKQVYMSDTAQRISNNYETAANGIFTLDEGLIELDKSIQTNKVSPELGRFFSIMKNTLQATGADQQTLDFLQIEDGEPVYDLNFPATLQKYTQIFLNYFSKAMSEKTPGVTVALVSDVGIQRVKIVKELDDNGQPMVWSVVSEQEYKKDPKRYETAKRWTDTKNRLFSGLKVGDYIVDDLRHNVPEYDNQGNIVGRFSEFIMPAHYPEQMRGMVEALQKGFGVRIPSDDKHSYISLKMVDYMPVVYGSSAVFPQELLEISGADFDIDKLYIQWADTYSNGDTRIAYGQAQTDRDKFEEYIIWQAENNKLVRDRVGILEETDSSAFLASVLGDDRQVVIQALSDLHMPSTVSEYINTGKELNNGVLNNRILAAKIVLLNNEHISGGGNQAIINQSTSTDPLTNLVQELIELFSGQEGKGVQDILDILQEPETDINTLDGKGSAYINNKEGSRNIGAAINSMLAFSVLEQFSVPIQGDHIQYNEQVYNTFAGSLTTDGQRKFAAISAIVNAMTDNAKERLAAKLGLNITVVGIVSTMVAQGIPLKDSVLYMLQPAVRRYFSRLKDSTGILRNTGDYTGADSLLAAMIQDIASDLPEDAVRESLTYDKLIQGIQDGGADKSIQLRVLEDLQVIKKQADDLRTLSQIMKLNQGVEATWEDTDRIEENLNKLGILQGKPVDDDIFSSTIDVRDILTNRHPIFSTYIKILGQIDELGKTVFIERTPLFNELTSMVRSNMSPGTAKRAEFFNKSLKTDLISYLSIKAYIHWLQTNDLTGTLSTLNHALIYNNAQENMAPDYENIAQVIKRLRDSTNNYMTNKFLRLVMADQEGNKQGINKATSNTWAKLSEHQQQRLYDSFVELYTDDKTHKDAETLFNYLLVKDGGKFANDSFIKYIPVFAFKDLLDRTKEINKMLVSGDENYVDIFGISKQELMTDFITGYGTHISNKWYNKEVSSEAVSKHHLTGNKPVTFTGTGLTVNLFAGIRPAGVTGKYTPEEIKMLGENIEALQYGGFRVDKIDDKNLITFSYTARDKQGNLYVLQTIDGKPVQYTNMGISAVYDKQPWRGSKGQWNGAHAIGPVPVQENTTNRRHTDSVDNPSYGPDTPGQDIEDVTVSPEPQGEIRDLNSPVLTQLTEQFGISAITDGKNNFFIKDDEVYNAPAGTTPKQLLEQLTGRTMISAQPVVSSQSMDVIPLSINFNRQMVDNDPAHIYLFTDNAKRSSGSNKIPAGTTYAKRYGQGNYPGMTQAVIRGLENAYPITTMVDDKRTQWADNRFDEYKKIIDSEIEHIKEAMASGQYTGMKFAAQMPFGKGQISNMRQSAPKIWSYMNSKLQEIGIDNTGEKPTIAIASSQLSSDQWKEQLIAIYNSKKRDRSMVEWMKEAISYRDGVKSLRGDNDIIEDIKKCIK